VWEKCKTWKKGGNGSWQEVCSRVLRNEGEGEGWIRKVKEERKRGMEERKE